MEAGRATIIIDADTKKLKKGTDQARKEVSKFSDVVKKMGVASMIGWGVATAAVTSYLKDATAASIAFEQRFASFTRLIEGDSQRFLRQLQEASEGTVSSLQLVTQANNAILLGIEQKQLPELLKAARVLGAAVGRTTEEAFADLTIGIGRQSRLILDNLGIIVKAGDAYEEYAKKIGKSVDALSGLERQQAFNIAVMEGLEESTGKLKGSITDATTASQQFKAQWEDFKIKAGDPVKKVLTTWLQGFNELVDIMENLREAGTPGENMTRLEALFGRENIFRRLTPEEAAAAEEAGRAEREEAAEAERRRWEMVREGANEVIRIEEDIKEIIRTKDLTQIENMKELAALEGLLNTRRQEGIDIMGKSFLMVLEQIRSKARDVEDDIRFGTRGRMTYAEFQAKRQEQIEAGLVTPASTF